MTGLSQRGLSHVRSGRGNEDAFQFLVCEDSESVVLAVADGHGSPLSFRSGVGSRIAVATAVPLLAQFANLFGSKGTNYPITNNARTALAENLTSTWHFAVRRHLSAKPFSRTELDELTAQEGPDGRRAVEVQSVLAYGSTLLGVIATQKYVLSTQLGDGAILLVDSEGRGRLAIPGDRPLVPTRVPSLAQRTAASSVRIQIQNASEGLPSLILAATDGYTECFPSDDDFSNVGSRYLQTAQAKGFDHVDQWMGSFLEEARTRGSQDDITVGLIARLEG